MDMIFRLALLLFFIFSATGAANDELVIPSKALEPNHRSLLFKHHLEGSLKFKLTEGGYYGEFKNLINGEIQPEPSTFMTNTYESLSELKKANLKRKKNDTIGFINQPNQFVTNQMSWYCFPQTFFDGFFLRGSKTEKCLWLKSGKNLESCSIQLSDALNNIKEAYFNETNLVFYYFNNNNEMKYADYTLLSGEYAHLFQAIKNIKSAHFLNVPTIWKNVLVFLKNSLCDAHGNRRLQSSLREVFFNNAGVVLLHLYYALLLFLACQRNENIQMIFIKYVAILHLSLHLILCNYHAKLKSDC